MYNLHSSSGRVYSQRSERLSKHRCALEQFHVEYKLISKFFPERAIIKTPDGGGEG